MYTEPQGLPDWVQPTATIFVTLAVLAALAVAVASSGHQPLEGAAKAQAPPACTAKAAETAGRAQGPGGQAGGRRSRSLTGSGSRA